jgi:hypothetical protein
LITVKRMACATSTHEGCEPHLPMRSNRSANIAGLMFAENVSRVGLFYHSAQTPERGKFDAFFMVDAAADRIERFGGAVHVPPQDILYVSRFSVVSDPQMATFALFKWQSLGADSISVDEICRPQHYGAGRACSKHDGQRRSPRRVSALVHELRSARLRTTTASSAAQAVQTMKGAAQ